MLLGHIPATKSQSLHLVTRTKRQGVRAGTAGVRAGWLWAAAEEFQSFSTDDLTLLS